MAAAMNDFVQKRGVSAGLRQDSSLDCAIDLVHLARQTLGDRALEIELLRLFERQCEQIVRRLEGPVGGDRRVRQDLAHTLKGSAQAVGAGAVAAAAARYEDLLGAAQSDEAATQALGVLRAAAQEARRAVASLLPEA